MMDVVEPMRAYRVAFRYDAFPGRNPEYTLLACSVEDAIHLAKRLAVADGCRVSDVSEIVHCATVANVHYATQRAIGLLTHRLIAQGTESPPEKEGD